MRVKVHQVRAALEYISKMYSVGVDSTMELTIQEDDPGDGKICSTFTMRVVSKELSNSLDIELFDEAENRPPNSVYTKRLS
jgi:hypothetical protein